jgi:hypothetical protein
MVKTKKGPRGRNFTPDERALMLKIALAGGSVEEINRELSSHQQSEGLSDRIISEGSYQMLIGTYLKHIGNDTASSAHIFHPAPMGKLKSRAALQMGQE